MRKILLLCDYLGHFGYKWAAKPYRSGMNKQKLSECFQSSGYLCEFYDFSDIDLNKMNFKNLPVLYTSSEDVGGHYKDYIEDVLLGLSLKGAILLPRFEFFRSHHNKVFMELLRDLMPITIRNIKSYHFGTLENLKRKLNEISYPCIIKCAAGAGSKGVFKASSEEELIKIAKKITRSRYWLKEIWDFGRAIKRKGYRRESLYRNKIIVQNFVEGLNHDWKVLVFGDRYYVLRRQNRKNDFRASGSGLLEYREDVPKKILEISKKICDYLGVPNIALDIAYDGQDVYLIEFQCVRFGTHALDTSPFYFRKDRNEWKQTKETSELEKVYVESIVKYLDILYSKSDSTQEKGNIFANYTNSTHP